MKRSNDECLKAYLEQTFFLRTEGMANASFYRHIRSLGKPRVSESAVCVEQISRFYNKYIGYLGKKKELYSGKFTFPVMGSSFPQTFGVFWDQQNISSAYNKTQMLF